MFRRALNCPADSLRSVNRRQMRGQASRKSSGAGTQARPVLSEVKNVIGMSSLQNCLLLTFLRLCSNNFWQVQLYPICQRFYFFCDFGAGLRQRVFHMRRHHRIRNPLNETIRFQPLQGLRQHFFADAIHLAP